MCLSGRANVMQTTVNSQLSRWVAILTEFVDFPVKIGDGDELRILRGVCASQLFVNAETFLHV